MNSLLLMMNAPLRTTILAFSFALAAAASGSPLPGEGVTWQSKPGRTALVELYTSEGCSSCPPADRWLSTLRNDPGLWRDLIPISFHVDYWNGLGWPDRFSQRAFSDRQQAYAAVWGSASVYTPGFVLNGEEWRDWGTRAWTTQAGAGGGDLRITRRSPTDWALAFRAAGTRPVKARVVLLGFDLLSDVRRGENAGRRLLHNFVALSYGSAALKLEADGVWRASVMVPDAASAGAVAAWVETAGSPAPLQAVGGWLPHASIP